MKKLILGCIAALVLFSAIPASAYWEWTPKTKKWINPKWAVKDTAEEQFASAEQYRKAGNREYMLREYNKVIKHFPKSEYAARSYLILGQIYEEQGNLEKAFDTYQKVVDNYPGSPLLDEALKKQYAVADKILKEKSNKFMELLKTEDHRVKKMRKVIENDPYGADTPERYFTLADFYIKTKDYGKAAECYETLTEEYPETDESEKAHVLLIRTRYLSIPKVNTDIGEYDKLQDEIEDFLVEYPGRAEDKEVAELNARLDEEKAGKLSEIAAYYERTGKKKAALIYYQKIARQFPKTKHGQTAQQKISSIR